MKDAAAILFDFGGTLDAPGVPWKERFGRHWRAEGLDVPQERFDRAFYDSADSMVGTIPGELALTGTVEELARRLSRNLGLAGDPRGERVAASFLAEARAHLAASVGILRGLAPRYRLGIVSNFYGNLETVCHNTSIRSRFGVVVDSVRAGFSKPDPRIFMRALDGLGVAPRDATFVGDSAARDMAGARALGMRHIWLIAEPPPGEPCCPGDAMIHSLTDVEALLL